MLGVTNVSSQSTPNQNLSISINGTNKLTYDGKNPKSLDITLASLGAAASNHAHNYLPLSGGTLTAGTESRLGGVSVYDNVASYTNTANDDHEIRGIIKITLPTGFVNTMLKIYISVYNYLTNTSADIIVSMYPFYEQTFHQMTAYCSNINLVGTIRVGRASNGNSCILLGTSSSVWSYPKIVVTKVIASFQEYTRYRTGWDISIIENETGITLHPNPLTINPGLNASHIGGQPLSNLMLCPRDGSGYPGMAPAGNTDSWVRTTSTGIIPAVPGGVLTGHQNLGTPGWHFLETYCTNFHGYWYYHNGILGMLSAVQAAAPGTPYMLWTY